MINCKDISVSYNNISILKQVSLNAQAGEFVAILGPNGSGKSTLLNVLGGTVKQDSGQLKIMGQVAQKLSPRTRARHVAVVPQRLDNMPHITVQDMVLLGRYTHLSWFGLYNQNDYAAANKAIQTVGAQNLKKRTLHTLSGGELQRVLLARALAQDAPILLLDELSAGLDLAKMIELFDILDKKREEMSCIITVMHDINLASLYATRLVGLKYGQICFDGPVNEVFTAKNLQELYHTKVHVFKHPSADVPQACPIR